MIERIMEMCQRYKYKRMLKSIGKRLTDQVDEDLIKDIIWLFNQPYMKSISVLVSRDYYITPTYGSAHELLLQITGSIISVVGEKRFLKPRVNTESIRLDQWFKKPDFITVQLYEDLNSSDWIVEFGKNLIKLKALKYQGNIPVEYFDRNIKNIDEAFIQIVEIAMEVTHEQ